uniref:Sushi domain-containing protein n=1 Tax=Tetraodon nigroviridis TaxID=99883 RepID=H3D4W4_TETNG
SFAAGEKVYYRCAEDFTPTRGLRAVQCSNGAWTKLTLKCEKGETTCSSPAVANALRPPGEAFRVGDSLNLTCLDGFQPDGAQQVTCGPEGRWRPPPPRCLSPARCRVPAAARNSNLADRYMSKKSFASGERVQYACDVGYVLVGRATRTCMSQGWDGREPVCEAVDCGEPPRVADAELSGSSEQPYAYQSVVRYRCRVGTLMGPNEVWCTQDGTWSPPPTCQDVTCPPPGEAGAYWNGPPRASYRPRDSLTIECKRRYARTGPSVVTCGSDGRWSPDLPWCAPT